MGEAIQHTTILPTVRLKAAQPECMRDRLSHPEDYQDLALIQSFVVPQEIMDPLASAADGALQGMFAL